ncbi:hypothetical protein BH20VER3_BH20VER3_06820 [soil metagenome]
MKLNSLYSRRGGFTLVEIMIAVVIVALLAAIAVPGFLRARKRSQASRVLNDLRILDSSIVQYAIENQRGKGAKVTFKDLKVYLKKGGQLYQKGTDILGNKYGPNFKVGTLPKVPTKTRKGLSDVANAAYWSPYP